MLVRVAGILLAALGAMTGCDGSASCIQVGSNDEFGTNHFEKIELISNHVKELRLHTSAREVAAIVGAAYAASQIEGGQTGVPVKICLRAGPADDTEFRVLSIAGKVLIEWQSTTKFRAP